MVAFGRDSGLGEYLMEQNASCINWAPTVRPLLSVPPFMVAAIRTVCSLKRCPSVVSKICYRLVATMVIARLTLLMLRALRAHGPAGSLGVSSVHFYSSLFPDISAAFVHSIGLWNFASAIRIGD